MKIKFLIIILIAGVFGLMSFKSYGVPCPPNVPCASVIEIEPSYVLVDVDVTLDGSDSFGNIVAYEWDFTYDGETFNCDYCETDVNCPDGDYDGITQCSYSSTGTYTVALKVIADSNYFNIDTSQVTVGAQ